MSAGLELLEPELELVLPPGFGYELSEQDGPLRPPQDAPRYPELLLLDGTTERADRWPIADRRSRLFVVAEVPEGWAVIRNAARGQALAMAWDAEWYRHCWVWHENRVSGGIWREQAEMIAVEPTTSRTAWGWQSPSRRARRGGSSPARWPSRGSCCGRSRA